MSRPTRLQLEETIERFEMQREDWPPELTSPFVLIDELRALQEELTKMTVYAQQLEDNHGELEAVEIRVARATITRIEALPVKWRDDMRHHQESVSECVRELEKALRGEP